MQKLFFIIVTLLLIGCKTKKPSISTTSDCDTVGFVKNHTGLDGCLYLIELENGNLLNPIQVSDPNFEFKENQKISLSYRIVPDAMSACMAESAIVVITCIGDLGLAEKNEDNCVRTNNPFEVNWMNQVLDRYNPTRITKFKFQKAWAYQFDTSNNSFLFDCEGNKLCDNFGNPNDDCTLKYFNQMTAPKVIWEGEGIWD